jgi:ketosteroid isomerase-like protein
MHRCLYTEEASPWQHGFRFFPRVSTKGMLMADNIEVLKRIYDRFNARDIDGVLAVLADDVAWANGLDGGHVHGLEAVREYWTRQWTIVSPHVEPVSFTETADSSVVVEVQQSVRDLEGSSAGAEGQDGDARLSPSRWQGHSLRHSGRFLSACPKLKTQRRAVSNC